MSNATAPKNTTAFYGQSMIAFGLALTAVTFGIWYLPVMTYEDLGISERGKAGKSHGRPESIPVDTPVPAEQT